ncbi:MULTISPECIES: serine hydrolase [unclassified Uliginosibacterium]|uniref:serine hydrolase n=1 Tax=unclassified Uliginosibacterium TaxID=2621521 RepID=UPI000C7B09D2|nr:MULTISPECIES: serine hydrolase [unclassified Uliginosibacterium]MDO6384731.1 serine hydrolase [Uliginosibacterium sp. 31-12]PLK48424.1 peptidase S11 [Uliginosibacterium sp. TH139]
MRVSQILLGLMSAVFLVVTPLSAEAASKKPVAKTSTKASASSKLTKPVAKKVKLAPSSVRSKQFKPVLENDFDKEGNPLIRSSAFFVQDVNTGEVLLERNASAPQPIASITKLMTAMVVLDAHQNLSEIIEVSDDDVDRLKGTSSRLAVGTQLSREDMLRLALMASENRAASSLARSYPGGMNAFLEAVAVKISLMGLHDTRIFDGTGLNKNNVSSARDLATLVANASRYPLIREFSTASEHTVALKGGRSHTFHSTNSLVKSPDWQIDVQKTGYISESGKCLVMQAWMGNKPLAIVLLDSWGRYTRVGDAQRIRKWLETMAMHRSQPVASAGHPGLSHSN